MTDIGDQIGYWDEREADRKRKQGKVDKLVNRARACRTFDGLQVVADDARGDGLWDADNGSLKKVIGECNARLRGRHVPARFKHKSGLEFTVYDNEAIDAPRWFHARDAKSLCRAGFLYAGQAEVSDAS